MSGGAWLGGILGQAYSRGVAVELGSGVNFVGNLSARYNAATGLVDVFVGVGGTPADALRLGADLLVGPVSVPAVGGETWQTLYTWSNLDTLISDGEGRSFTVELHVRTGNYVDVVSLHAVLNRDGGTITALNDDASPKEVTEIGESSAMWEIEIPIAGWASAGVDTLIALRLASDGESGIQLDVQAHASVSRTLTARVYLGNEADE